MTTNCVKITFESEEFVTCKTTQQIDDADVVEKWKCSERPVYLFANEHLEVLCQHVDVVLDLGVKDDVIQLARYFAPKKKQGKVPLLKTKYKSKNL